MADRIQLRRDSAANWTNANPVLSDGEVGLEQDTRKFKVGDGTTAWSSLPYGGIQGPEGPQGPAGTDGATWHDGSGAPSAALGDDGDYYLDTSNGDIHEKAAGAWSIIANIKGPQGDKGEGIPVGGAAGDVLTKDSATDYDSSWAPPAVQSVDGKTGAVDLSQDYETRRQHNLTATADPTVNDDSGAGYEPLSKWVNTSTGEVFVCLDATAGAANWQLSTLTIDDLGSAATQESSTLLDRANHTGTQPLSTISDAGTAAAADTGKTIGDVAAYEDDGAGSPVINHPAMPQVAGDPIVEEGSNANGEYVRFASGKQICVQTAATSNTADNTWVFPAAFTSPPARGVLANTGLQNANAHMRNTGSLTSEDYAGWDSAGNRAALSCSLFAIGRWK